MTESTLYSNRANSANSAEPKRVCVFWYSQTGQLKQAADAFVAPLQEAGWSIRWIKIEPTIQFPFPWPIHRFFSIFPQCVDRATNTGIETIPASQLPAHDEIILFAFQVWYLSPSLPMRAVLLSVPEAFRGRRVIGLTACRSMWWSAAIEVRRLLKDAGSRYLGTIAVTDTTTPFHSLVTTLKWLFTGSREKFWRFGRAGVGPEEYARLGRLGQALVNSVVDNSAPLDWVVRETLEQHAAAPLDASLAAADLLISQAFQLWGRVIRSSDRRGVAARSLAMISFIAFLAATISIGIPSLALARAIGGTRFNNWIEHRIDNPFGDTVAKGATWKPKLPL
ncbi:hypothetical protein [Mycobacterium sp. 852002-40037_SCH5390672]|uniref:hypothetical protein n=1 Tax=Mycobacterium sp. 852002-40037_SCH5390672 TaxID=1834089 RepID=UPI000AB6680B|nr:hypothetical protein [Mycobacterium sp. 852002-40037_SCH5390672]